MLTSGIVQRREIDLDFEDDSEVRLFSTFFEFYLFFFYILTLYLCFAGSSSFTCSRS